MRAQKIEFKQKFSKGFAWTKGENNVPIQYGAVCQNIRIQDLWIVPRWGTELIYQWTAWHKIQWIFAYENTNRLFRIYQWKLEEVDIVAGTITDRSWAITMPTTWAMYMFSFDKYIIICTGTTLPYTFNTNTNTLVLDTTLPASTFPSFGSVFWNYTFLAYKNILYFSKPITLTNPEYAVNWTTWTWTQQIVYKEYINGLKSTLDKLWITVGSDIEFLDQNTVSNVGSTVNIFSTKFGQDQNVLNNAVIVPVGSKLFYVTKWFKIRAIGYTQWVAQLQIADISDVPAVGIDNFLQTKLAADQSKAFGFFDEKNNIIKRHFVPLWSLEPTLVVGYSLINMCYIEDTWLAFGWVTTMWSRIFAYSCRWDNKILEFEVWKSDLWNSYKCVYESQNIKYWQPNLVKFHRWAEFGWKMNQFTRQVIESFVDWKSAMRPYISYPISSTNGWLTQGPGIAESALWEQAVAGTIWVSDVDAPLLNYNMVITSSMVRLKGKAIKWRLTMEGIGQDWIIDYMAGFVLPSTRYQLSDKF